MPIMPAKTAIITFGITMGAGHIFSKATFIDITHGFSSSSYARIFCWKWIRALSLALGYYRVFLSLMFNRFKAFVMAGCVTLKRAALSPLVMIWWLLYFLRKRLHVDFCCWFIPSGARFHVWLPRKQRSYANIEMFTGLFKSEFF